jgi:hypothetical protein
MWSGEIYHAAETIKSLAIHEINYTSKDVIRTQLVGIKSLCEAMESQLLKQVTE